jgi:hypothetical protein
VKWNTKLSQTIQNNDELWQKINTQQYVCNIENNVKRKDIASLQIILSEKQSKKVKGDGMFPQTL